MAGELLPQIHALELELFKHLSSIFEKHNIKYFFIGGSALGAVRHKGFIPWDDDIDIGIPREDYERFLEICKSELSDRYLLQEPGFGCPSGFAKIRIKDTLYVEQSTCHLDINHGIFLDIFPLDGVPSDEKLKSKHLKAVKRQILITTACFINPDALSGFAKKTVAKLCGTFLNGNKQNLKLQRLMKKYPYSQSEIIANYTGAWWTKEMMQRSIMGDGTMLEFEGISVRVPENYHAYLTNLYKDYMRLPPEEKRVSHHGIVKIDVGKNTQ